MKLSTGVSPTFQPVLRQAGLLHVSLLAAQLYPCHGQGWISNNMSLHVIIISILQVDAEEAAILSTIFDVGGIIGGIIAGTLSDKTGKPASTCAIMLGRDDILNQSVCFS